MSILSSMQRLRVNETLAALAALGALTAIAVSTCEWPPSGNRRIHEAIGQALARQALGLLGSSGQITVITRDTVAFKQPASEILLESLKSEVRKVRATSVKTLELQVDPLRPVQVPPGDFFELIRKASSGDVIVSLMGPPFLTEEQHVQLGAIKPRIVAFCSGNLADYIDLRVLFDQQLLHAAVVSRPNAPGSSSNPEKPQQSFEQLYAIVTATNPAPIPLPMASQ